ncbi:MAG: hypothetical protein ACXABI_11880 [Candidatus Hodarchaeales archaeon]|jgi:predicted transcriptional regulator
MTDTNSKSSQNKHRDIVDFEPVILKVLDDKKTLDLLSDLNYHGVISVLRNGAMTVQEITKAYNNYAVKTYDIKEKSDKTIYRYLKTLSDSNIVVHAGQRINEEKGTSERLYMRSARVFERKDIEWMSEKGDIWADQFGLFISSMLEEDSEPNKKCIQAFFNQWAIAKTNTLEKLATSAPKEIMNIIDSKNWKDFAEFIDRVYLFGTLMNHPELLDDLRKCFKGK